MRYEWDYALLPTEFPIGHSITNPTEAWILPASDSYFRRCRIPGDRKSSDFDRFSAMLQSLDRMTGNPDAEYWKSKMQALPTRSEDPATLWSAAADLLAGKTLVDLYHEETREPLPPFLSSQALPSPLSLVTDLNRIADAVSGVNLSDWEERLTERMDALASQTVGLRLFLPSDYEFAEPNPHTVAEALRKNGQGSGERNSLLSQLFRFASDYAEKRNLPLLLESRTDGNNTARLFIYAEQSVGLPEKICLSLPSARELSAVDRPLTGQKIHAEYAFRPTDFPCMRELITEISFYAARFPIGTLSPILGTDLRLTMFWRARTECACQTFLKEHSD